MSILELSLESYDSKSKVDSKEEKLIVMQGPLSDLIYRALNITYSKSNGENKLMDYAIESMAQDVVIANNIIESAATDDEVEDPNYVIFGVSKMDVDEDVVKEVKSILDESKDAEVIVMVTEDNPSTDTAENPIQTNADGHISAMTALESLMKDHPYHQKSKLIKGFGFLDAIGSVASLLLPGF